MIVHTIGFTKKSASRFFSLLNPFSTGIERVIDIRLHNKSNISGFAKQDHLSFFLRQICDVDYVHLPILAPSQDLYNDFIKKKKNERIDWATYERRFNSLLVARQVERTIDQQIVDRSCLLCSEASPDKCHRRLVVEYLQDCWDDFEIVHLQ
jgi:uncharacterized protein (DUF488 family)